MREAYPNELMHFGILGMRWGIRRFQTATGKLTRAGIDRYRKHKDEEYRHEVKAHRLSEQEQRLSIAREKADARQERIERRLENQRARLENQRQKIENKRAALENTDYANAILRGKSTKSYRDQKLEKDTRLNNAQQKQQNNNQNNNQGNNQNQSNQTINSLTIKDIPNTDIQNLSNQDLNNLVSRLSNEQRLNDIYKNSLPPSKAKRAAKFVDDFGKAVKVVAGIGTSAIAIYGLKTAFKKAKIDKADVDEKFDALKKGVESINDEVKEKLKDK